MNPLIKKSKSMHDLFKTHTKTEDDVLKKVDIKNIKDLFQLKKNLNFHKSINLKNKSHLSIVEKIAREQVFVKFMKKQKINIFEEESDENNDENENC